MSYSAWIFFRLIISCQRFWTNVYSQQQYMPITQHPSTLSIITGNSKKMELCYLIGKMLSHFCFTFYCLLLLSWTSKIPICHMHSASLHFLFIPLAHLECTLKANSHHLYKREQGLSPPFNPFPPPHFLTADLTLISEH